MEHKSKNVKLERCDTVLHFLGFVSSASLLSATCQAHAYLSVESTLELSDELAKGEVLGR